MQYNIADVVAGRKAEVKIECQVVIDDALALLNHATAQSSSIKASGKVYRSNDLLWIRLTYEGMVQFVCDRCLQAFDYPISGQFKRQLSKRDEFDVEWLIIANDRVDLAAAITDDLIVKLPIQLICSDQCKGLCATCGTDLNQSRCQCQEESIDPRLASLKNLFN